jgi:hypothetical protein
MSSCHATLKCLSCEGFAVVEPYEAEMGTTLCWPFAEDGAPVTETTRKPIATDCRSHD